MTTGIGYINISTDFELVSRVTYRGIGNPCGCLIIGNISKYTYGPGFKDLTEEQKYHVCNAPYTAAVTGEDVADIIDKLRSMYQDAKAKWVWEGDEETGDWVWSETGE